MEITEEQFDFTEFINNLTSIIYPQAELRKLSFEVYHTVRWTVFTAATACA